MAVEQVVQLVLNGHPVMEALEIVSVEEELTMDSLRSAYYRSRHKFERLRFHGNAVLTDDQETLFLIATKIMAGMDMPWTIHQGASALLSMFSVKVSSRWVQRFWKKNQQPLRSVKALSKSRTQTTLSTKVMLFADQFSTYLLQRKGPLSPKCLINVDEARVVIEGGVLKAKRAVDPSRRSNLRFPHGGTVASLVSFVAASGESLMHVIVLKKKTKRDVITAKIKVRRYPVRGEPLILYAATETGYVDQLLFTNIMTAFADRLEVIDRGGLETVVLSDQLTLHRDEKTIQQMLVRGVLMWSLPANTSHVTQPLDDLLFANFKSAWYKQSHELLYQSVLREFSDGKKTDWRSLMLPLLFDVIEQTFTSETIVQSFENTMLFPFDRKKFIERTIRHLNGVNLDASGALDAAATHVRLMIDNAVRVVEKIDEESVEVELSSLSAIHDPHMLVHAIQQKRRASEQLKRTKENDIRARTCRGGACQRVHRGAKSWKVCECTLFRICPTCIRSGDIEIWNEHLDECGAQPVVSRSRTT